ncbi:MAG: pilus assembly protein TadG-related protein [Marinibacterium sp.]
MKRFCTIFGRPAGHGPGLCRHLTQFRRREDGAMVIFGVYIFLMMLLIGGIGIDVMRFERERTMVQYTLDRAVLAAADLDQQLDPQMVVQDYFDKAGLDAGLSSVSVDQGLGYRIVSGSAQTAFDTQFMHMTGIERLNAFANSTAEESIDGVEISLVLDVSGSMNSNNRLTNLKVAAKDFVDEMFDNSQAGKVSISIVPYATQVTVPDNVWSYLTTSDEADDAVIVDREYQAGNTSSYPGCINFDSADFDITSIDLTHEYERTLLFDPWRHMDGRDNDPMDLVTRPVCDNTDSRKMVVLESDRNVLKNFIDNMWGGGNTSIDIGMKWGTALIDPSMRPVIDGLVASGDVDANFDGRPLDYDDSTVLKVIVLMTDGQNTSQYYINDGYRDGESNIWWNEQEEKYSVYVGLDVDDDDNDGIYDEPLFYWPHTGDWKDHAYGEGTYPQTDYQYVCKAYKRNGSCKRYKRKKITVMVDEPGHAEIVSYPDLWAWTTMKTVVESLYEPWMNDSQAWDDWYYDVRNYVGTTTKNTRTSNICNAVKAENVVVFTIGFEAPSSGLAVLQDCASSPSHFFDVDGLEISDAFSAIASSIRQLRLTN